MFSIQKLIFWKNINKIIEEKWYNNNIPIEPIIQVDVPENDMENLYMDDSPELEAPSRW